MTRWSATTPTPPPLLRTRLRLALHSSGGKGKTKVVHHERGRYSPLTLMMSAILSISKCAVKGKHAASDHAIAEYGCA